MPALPESEPVGALSPHELRQAALALSCWAHDHAHAGESVYAAETEPHARYHLRHVRGGDALYRLAMTMLGEIDAD